MRNCPILYQQQPKCFASRESYKGKTDFYCESQSHYDLILRGFSLFPFIVAYHKNSF